MRKTLFLFFVISIFMISFTWAQPGDSGTVENGQKLRQLNEFFENRNVGNLHLYANNEDSAGLDYYFKGERIPRGYLDLIDPEWRNDHSQSLKAFAFATIRGPEEDAPYYIIRFEGEGIRNMIGLFRTGPSYLEFAQSLAMYWCELGHCVQQDSWIIDLDGDTRFDIIKKMRIFSRDSSSQPLREEYQMIYTQVEEGDFLPTTNIPVEIEDYMMQEQEVSKSLQNN